MCLSSSSLRSARSLGESKELVEPRGLVSAMLPRIDLPEVLLEIHTWTGFLSEFTHITDRVTGADPGADQRMADDQRRAQPEILRPPAWGGLADAVRDQVAGLGAVLVPGTVRDSLYVLDCLLDLDGGD